MLKKRLKEKVFKNNEGKLVTDYKRKYSVDSNTYTFVPADVIMLLKEDHDLSNFKSVIISYFKEKKFTADIKPTNGGGKQTTFESVINEDGKQSPLKIPFKVYHRNKNIMIQGCEKSQEDFLKFYVSYKTDSIKRSEDMFHTSQVRPSYSFSRHKFSSPVVGSSDKIGTRPSSLKDF